MPNGLGGRIDLVAESFRCSAIVPLAVRNALGGMIGRSEDNQRLAPWNAQSECDGRAPWHRGQTSECLPTSDGLGGRIDLVAESFRCSAIVPLAVRNALGGMIGRSEDNQRLAPWNAQSECDGRAPWHRGQTSECLPTSDAQWPRRKDRSRGRIIPMFGHRSTCGAHCSRRNDRPQRRQSTACFVERAIRVRRPCSVAPWANIRMFAHKRCPMASEEGSISWPNHSDVRPSFHLRCAMLSAE